MENNFRENKKDILKEWLDFREDTELAYLTEEDKKHYIQFDEISERILKNVPKQNHKYVKKQHLNYLIEISWIMFVIIMRSIIEMDLWMVCS